MVKDFSYRIYRHLVTELQQSGYQFQTFESFLNEPLARTVMIRHDIDVSAKAALPFMRIEHELGLKASYYFRTLKGTYKPSIFREAVGLGHELGYHYEDLARNAGDMDKAVSDFKRNLAMFRQHYPVQTVCMHGSSGSQFDNRDMWKTSSFSEHGLLGEPYVSLDFNKVLYLSDTSKRWNGSAFALRDKVESSFQFSFTTTWDILKYIDKLPNQIMLTIHPEYWADDFVGRAKVNLFVLVHSYYKKYYRNSRSRRKALNSQQKLASKDG